MPLTDRDDEVETKSERVKNGDPLVFETLFHFLNINYKWVGF